MNSKPDATARQLTEQQIKTIKQMFKALQRLQAESVHFQTFQNLFRVTIKSPLGLPSNRPPAVLLFSDNRVCEVRITNFGSDQMRLDFRPTDPDRYHNKSVQIWLPANKGVFFIAMHNRDIQKSSQTLLDRLQMMIFGNAPEFTPKQSAVIPLFNALDYPHATQYSVGSPHASIGYMGHVSPDPFWLTITVWDNQLTRQVELRCATPPRLHSSVTPLTSTHHMRCAFGDASFQIDCIADPKRTDMSSQSKWEEVAYSLLAQDPLPVSNYDIQRIPKSDRQTWRLYLRESEIPEVQITVTITSNKHARFSIDQLFIEIDSNRNWVLGCHTHKPSGSSRCVIQ
jgi:hypothetical protein